MVKQNANGHVRRRFPKLLLSIALVGALVLALSACDRKMTGTVGSDDTVDVTLVLALTPDEIDAIGGADYHTDLNSARTDMRAAVANVLPTAVTSDYVDGGEFAGVEATAEGISYDDFEAAMEEGFNDHDDEGIPDPVVSLRRVDGTYVLEATNLTHTRGHFYNDFLHFNELTLTFPEPVTSANGWVRGNSVHWDFKENPTSTLRAKTARTAACAAAKAEVAEAEAKLATTTKKLRKKKQKLKETKRKLKRAKRAADRAKVDKLKAKKQKLKKKKKKLKLKKKRKKANLAAARTAEAAAC